MSSNIHTRLVGDRWWNCVVIGGTLYLLRNIGKVGHCLKP